MPEPFVLLAPIVRKNTGRPAVEARPEPSSAFNLLAVTDQRGECRDLGYRTITRPLIQNLCRAGRYAESLDYRLEALPIFAEVGDGRHLAATTPRNLVRLWRAWGDDTVVARTAEAMGQPVDEVREGFEKVLAETTKP